MSNLRAQESVNVRERVLELHLERVKPATIAERVGVSATWVRELIAQYRSGTKAPTPSIWTDERVAELKRLAAENLTANEIAKAMGGGVTRNAVIGKLNREKIAHRPRTRKRTQADRQAAIARRQAAARRAKPVVRRPTGNSTAAAFAGYVHIEPELAEQKAAEYMASPSRRHAFDADHAPADAKKLPLLQVLASGGCKWPLFEDGPMIFCGAPVEARDSNQKPTPYCACHTAMAYHKITVGQ